MNKPGFLLIEMLVATALFLGALFTLAYAFQQTFIIIDRAQGKSQAYYSLQNQMEELRVIPFPNLLAKNGQSFAKGQGKIAVSQISSSLVLIQAQLDWRPNQPALVFQTLRSCYE